MCRYVCQTCGSQFSYDEVIRALRNGDVVIGCRACGAPYQLVPLPDDLREGYRNIEDSNWSAAESRFNKVINQSSSETGNDIFYAYIGNALVSNMISAVYPGNNFRAIPERFFVNTCHGNKFSDDYYIKKARQWVEGITDATERSYWKTILNKYTDRLDNFAEKYNRIKESGNRYNAVIVYEDDVIGSEDYRSGKENAELVARQLRLGGMQKIYIPDHDRVGDPAEYEAELLYACQSTNCMLVITDNDPNQRIMQLYGRYYNIKNSQKTLGFVRCNNDRTVYILNRPAKNMFNLDNVKEYGNFARKSNGAVALDEWPSRTSTTEDEEEFVAETIVPTIITGEQTVQFGSFPQDRVSDPKILAYFRKIALPAPGNTNGWKVLYTSGNSVAWYRDEEYNNSKYRVVYFRKYRSLHASLKSSSFNPYHNENGYRPGEYVFKFRPLVWRIMSSSINGKEGEEESNLVEELVASCALFSAEFNNKELSNEWKQSTLHDWLNNDFLNTAFTEEERETLLSDIVDGSDKVFLLNEDKTGDNRYFNDASVIRGSDYAKCVGGSIGRNGIVSSYWINSSQIDEGNEYSARAIQPNSGVGRLTQIDVDTSSVAVVPKIIRRAATESDTDEQY